MSPAYAHMHEQQQNAPLSSQPYANQSYTSIQEHPAMPMSPQSYFTIHEHQRSTIQMSPQSYTNLPGQQQQDIQIQSQTYPTEPYTITEQQSRDIQMSPQYASYTNPPSSPPPRSPGPLPLKVNPDAPTRSDIMIVAPDANPLQSPQLPSFPPPTRAATTHAPVEDLGEYHQPGQIMHPNQEVRGGGWSNGLCEFSNFGIYCLGLICPCILYGRTQHRLTMKSRKEDPTNMLAYETCNGSCTGMGLLCGCQCKFILTLDCVCVVVCMEEKVHLANMSPQGCWQPFSTQEQGRPMESRVILHRIVCGQPAAHVAR